MAILNKENTHKLLYKFVAHDKPNMNKPFSQELKIGKYLCATDAHIVILIPETEENKIENEEGYKPPNINGILPKFSDNIEVDVANLQKLYSDIKFIDRDVTRECESCDGDGKFEHYGNYYKCKECNETGKVKTGDTEKVKDPHTEFKFKNINLHVNSIQKLLEVCASIDAKNIKVVRLEKSPVWFNIDGAIIAMCGMLDIEEDEKPRQVINVIN